MDKTKHDELYSEIIHFHIPRWNEFPDIDLYLDQISSLLEKYLSLYIKDDIKNADKNDKKGEKDENDKIITKAMISNYIKQKVLDPPVNKKYTKIHIAKLFVISILKQIYSINDINNLIALALKTTSIENAYNEFCDEIEKAIYSTFNQSINSEENIDLSKTKYILKNVAQSFASKLFVEKAYLKLPN